MTTEKNPVLADSQSSITQNPIKILYRLDHQTLTLYRDGRSVYLSNGDNRLLIPGIQSEQGFLGIVSLIANLTNSTLDPNSIRPLSGSKGWTAILV